MNEYRFRKDCLLPQIKIYFYWIDIIKKHPTISLYEILEAIFQYAKDGTVAELHGDALMAFEFIKISLDEQIAAFSNHKQRQSTEYRQWRKSVFERDNYTCQVCGVSGGELNAHHIKPFSVYPDLRFDVSNGLTLCKQCHINVHKAEREWLN